jgi:hypothetical protein
MYSSSSNFLERIMATYTKKRVNKIVWQPRIEHWYDVRKVKGTLPEKYKNKGVLEIYDDLSSSVRYYYGSTTDISSPKTYIKFEHTERVKVREVRKNNDIHLTYETPIGQLRGKKRLGEWGTSWHYVEHPAKSISDLRILECVVENTKARFDYEFYKEAENKVGHRGVIQFYWERSPFQRLLLEYMGVENTIYALQDYPKRMREYLKTAEEAENQLYEVLAKCPVFSLNFGENIDAHFDPPKVFNEYLLPYYKKRVAQLHKAGKFCFIHMDGSLKPLLPYINDAGFDGVEGATSLPQGDITLEELKEALGDTILIDGIPMLLFLPHYSYKELEEYTIKVLNLFSPNLILGISDEISPPGDIEKVRFVSQIVESFKV